MSKIQNGTDYQSNNKAHRQPQDFCNLFEISRISLENE